MRVQKLAVSQEEELQLLRQLLKESAVAMQDKDRELERARERQEAQEVLPVSENEVSVHAAWREHSLIVLAGR